MRINFVGVSTVESMEFEIFKSVSDVMSSPIVLIHFGIILNSIMIIFVFLAITYASSVSTATHDAFTAYNDLLENRHLITSNTWAAFLAKVDAFYQALKKYPFFDQSDAYKLDEELRKLSTLERDCYVHADKDFVMSVAKQKFVNKAGFPWMKIN